MMLVFIFALLCNANAQLRDGLVAYWPLDGISGETAPDVVGGYNMELTNMDDSNVVEGKVGNAFSFSSGDQTLLSRTHEEGDDLPINKHESFTVSFWAKIQGNGQNDLRVFSESNTGGNNTPLFNLGTRNNGSDGTVDIYIRGIGPTVGHIFTEAEPFDDEWSHVVFVQEDLERKIYVDGELDSLEIAARAEGDWDLNATSIGGIIRGSASHWVTGLIDEVALWKRALSESEVSDLNANGVPQDQVPLIPDLIAYWPFDGDLSDKAGNNDGEAQGTDDISYDDGQFGQGIDLDGVDQFIQTPVENEEVFDFQDGTGFSISAWYRVDEFTKSWQALIAKGEGNRWRIHRRGGEGQLTGNGGSGDVAGATGDINDGEIHHLVLVSDPENGEVHFYSDGELVSSGGAPALQSNDNPMMIGENPDARGRTWGGLIDDVGVFNRPITEDEVALIYNGGNGNPLMVGGVIIPKPKTKLASSMSGFSVELTDDEEGSTVDAAGVSATFDGAALEVTTAKADGVTTFSYETPALLEAGTEHFVVITVKDTEGATHTIEKSFKVKPYTVVDAGSRAGDSLKGESGIVANITQISTGQNIGNLHGNNTANAEKAFNGWGNDPETEEAYLNEADPDSFEGWSYYPVLVPVVNFDQDGGVQGNFNSNNGYDDEYIPNIPGWGDSTDGIVGEFTALLELKKGAYKLGVNSDDGFKATIGANFTDMLAQELGSFNGGRGAADTTFTIYVQEDGLYPYRVIWFEGGGGANVELFSFVDGEKVLINDPDVDGSIKAYSLDGITFEETTTDRVDTGRASVVSMSPANGDKLVKSGAIELVIKNGSVTTVDQSSAAISLNGAAVDAKVSKIMEF